MALNSEISWTHHTGNLWWGCQEVHAGCDNCYARVLDQRWSGDSGGHWGAEAPRRLIRSWQSQFVKMQKIAAAAGEIHRVFVGSMMDIFEKPKLLVDINGKPIEADGVPVTSGVIRELFFTRVVPECPNLLFLLLTKRPGNILKYIPAEWKINPPKNVMYGTSPVDQVTFDDMIPKLVQVPGKRFLSCEPLLGPINMYPWLNLTNDARTNKPGSAIDWVIVGGESGQKARPMHPDWACGIQVQCGEAGVPFLFKQWGEYLPACQVPTNENLSLDQYKEKYISRARTFVSPNNPDKMNTYFKVGKSEAGCKVFGQEYKAFPVI
jgi:protein gp37